MRKIATRTRIKEDGAEEAANIYANLSWMRKTIDKIVKEFEERKKDVESRSPYTSSAYIENDVRVSGGSHRAPHESPTIQMKDEEREIINLVGDFDTLVRVMNSAIEYAVIQADLGIRPRIKKALNANLKDGVAQKELASLNIRIGDKTLIKYRKIALKKAAESIKLLKEDGNRALKLFK